MANERVVEILRRAEEIRQELRDLDAELREIRRLCPHENQRDYSSDEGGKFHHGKECSDCGETLR